MLFHDRAKPNSYQYSFVGIKASLHCLQTMVLKLAQTNSGVKSLDQIGHSSQDDCPLFGVERSIIRSHCQPILCQSVSFDHFIVSPARVTQLKFNNKAVVGCWLPIRKAVRCLRASSFDPSVLDNRMQLSYRQEQTHIYIPKIWMVSLPPDLASSLGIP